MHSLPADLHHKPFTLQQALERGLTRYHLNQLVSQGAVEHVARGVYRKSEGDVSDEDQYRAAVIRVGKLSAICLISALAHYGLTDSIPKKTWILVPANKRIRSSDLKLLRSRSPSWSVGIERQTGYAITSLERTIVDCLVYRRKLGSSIGIQALRAALAAKRTTLGAVMDMAVKLQVDHRIHAYIEALS